MGASGSDSITHEPRAAQHAPFTLLPPPALAGVAVATTGITAAAAGSGGGRGGRGGGVATATAAADTFGLWRRITVTGGLPVYLVHFPLWRVDAGGEDPVHTSAQNTHYTVSSYHLYNLLYGTGVGS